MGSQRKQKKYEIVKMGRDSDRVVTFTGFAIFGPFLTGSWPQVAWGEVPVCSSYPA